MLKKLLGLKKRKSSSSLILNPNRNKDEDGIIKSMIKKNSHVYVITQHKFYNFKSPVNEHFIEVSFNNFLMKYVDNEFSEIIIPSKEAFIRYLKDMKCEYSGKINTNNFYVMDNIYDIHPIKFEKSSKKTTVDNLSYHQAFIKLYIIEVSRYTKLINSMV